MTLYGSLSDFTYDVGQVDPQYLYENLPTDAFLWVPIAYMQAKLGSDSPVFQFWCKMCGQIWQPMWIRRDTFCIPGPKPQYPCLDGFQFDQWEVCGYGWQWLYSAFWAEFCNEAEGPCFNF